MSERIKKTFKNKNKKLVTFTTGGDPDLETSFEILKKIINNKIDIIEIGMPFSDPMADGPTIQESSTRSIGSGTTIKDIFELVTKIRNINNDLGWSPKVDIENGIDILLKNIDYWKKAPVWDPESIEQETRDWFLYLGKNNK